MFMIALSVVSTIVINLNLKSVNTKEVKGRSKKLFLCWLPRILRITPPPNIFGQHDQIPSRKMQVGDAITLDINPSDQMDAMVEFGLSSNKKLKQQWIFIATVVDRLCLVISLAFIFVSVTVFLIYAF